MKRHTSKEGEGKESCRQIYIFLIKLKFKTCYIESPAWASVQIFRMNLNALIFNSLVCGIVTLIFFLLLFKFSAFFPHPSPPPQPSLSPYPISTPLVIVHMSFIIFPINPSTFFPIIPSPLPSDHYQPILNFNVFVYTLLACSFCSLGSC